MFFKKDSDYLDKEKDIYHYLKRALKLLRILSILNNKKEKIFKEIAEINNQLEMSRFEKRSLVERIFKRKESSDKDAKLIDEMGKSSELLLKIIRRQENLLVKEIKTGHKEEELFQQIIKMPLFNKLNLQEKSLAKDLVYQQEVEINKLLGGLGLYLKFLVEQKEKIKNGASENKYNLNCRYMNSTSLLTEKDLISSCMIGIEKLIKESERIIEENKIIEEYFNPADLAELDAIIKEQLKTEKYRVNFLKAYFNEQRKLRDPINARQLIAVHLTDTFPEDGLIKPRGTLKFDFDGRVITAGSIFSRIRSTPSRQTIHFSLNGPVTSHLQGNWDNKKYAILIPVTKIIDRILNLSPQDAFVFGELSLPFSSEIIVQGPITPKDLEEYKQEAGKAKLLITKEGENVRLAAIRRIKELGYTRMVIGQWGWLKSEDPIAGGFMNQVLKEGLAADLNKEFIKHSSSFWGETENILGGIRNWVFDDLKKETIKDYEEKILDLSKRLKERSAEFNSPEERRAYHRLKSFMKRLYKLLKRKEKFSYGFAY